MGKADFYGLEGGTAGGQYVKSREPKEYRVDGQIQTDAKTVESGG